MGCAKAAASRRIYSTHDANGLYQYRDQTCGAMGICSQNQGHGSFRTKQQ
jgi:hypothetical protein